MNIALVGYGRMGREIEVVAIKRGHTIKLIIDQENESDLIPENLKNIDVAIEFSFPDAAFSNIKKCLINRIPVVSGTTGWLDAYDIAAQLCIENNTSFIHSTNFSIGVNLLFRLNSDLAGRMKQFNNYRASIEEIHHTKKLDAPSGTAITLSDGICKNNPAYTGWCFENDQSQNCIPMTSIREGIVPGTHTVTWDSEIDTISLKHISKNRSGLAMGAVIAAEYIQPRQGVFTMNDVLGF
jgi:4-hydroxy-tetrahydrodipicolinate reductase